MTHRGRGWIPAWAGIELAYFPVSIVKLVLRPLVGEGHGSLWLQRSPA